jgi:5-methylcytosine-specific restriction endonuclease McrA
MLGHAERFAKPLTLGGSNTDDNVQLLCPTCNIRKGSTHPSEYEARIGYQQPAQAAFR